MKSIALIILSFTNTIFCLGQGVDDNSVDQCERGKKHAKEDIKNKSLQFISFGLENSSNTFRRLLLNNGISTISKGCEVRTSAFYFSCYNTEMVDYIDSIKGRLFLDSLRSLANQMDEVGIGDRLAYPIGIKGLRNFLDEKVRSSGLNLDSIKGKVVELKMDIDKQGKIISIEKISGDNELYEILKKGLANLTWVYATKEGVPYETSVPVTYLYIEK